MFDNIGIADSIQLCCSTLEIFYPIYTCCGEHYIKIEESDIGACISVMKGIANVLSTNKDFIKTENIMGILRKGLDRTVQAFKDDIEKRRYLPLNKDFFEDWINDFDYGNGDVPNNLFIKGFWGVFEKIKKNGYEIGIKDAKKVFIKMDNVGFCAYMLSSFEDLCDAILLINNDPLKLIKETFKKSLLCIFNGLENKIFYNSVIIDMIIKMMIYIFELCIQKGKFINFKLVLCK